MVEDAFWEEESHPRMRRMLREVSNAASVKEMNPAGIGGIIKEAEASTVWGK